jgi:hypothetical protein
MKFDNGQNRQGKWLFTALEPYDAQSALTVEMSFEHDAAEVLLWCSQNLSFNFECMTQRHSLRTPQLDTSNSTILELEYQRLVILLVLLDSKRDAALFKVKWG